MKKLTEIVAGFTVAAAFVGVLALSHDAFKQELAEGNFKAYTRPGTCQQYVGDKNDDGVADVARTYCVDPKAPRYVEGKPTRAEIDWYAKQK